MAYSLEFIEALRRQGKLFRDIPRRMDAAQEKYATLRARGIRLGRLASTVAAVQKNVRTLERKVVKTRAAMRAVEPDEYKIGPIVFRTVRLAEKIAKDLEKLNEAMDELLTAL
jgi:hypothetical protein